MLSSVMIKYLSFYNILYITYSQYSIWTRLNVIMKSNIAFFILGILLVPHLQSPEKSILSVGNVYYSLPCFVVILVLPQLIQQSTRASQKQVSSNWVGFLLCNQKEVFLVVDAVFQKQKTNWRAICQDSVGILGVDRKIN